MCCKRIYPVRFAHRWSAIWVSDQLKLRTVLKNRNFCRDRFTASRKVCLIVPNKTAKRYCTTSHGDYTRNSRKVWKGQFQFCQKSTTKYCLGRIQISPLRKGCRPFRKGRQHRDFAKPHQIEKFWALRSTNKVCVKSSKDCIQTLVIHAMHLKDFQKSLGRLNSHYLILQKKIRDWNWFTRWLPLRRPRHPHDSPPHHPPYQ